MKKCQPRTLTPYLDGELSDEMRQDIDQHLQSCASCGTLLEQLTDASRQVRSMGRAVIPATALEPALDIFIERAGLSPSSSMRHTVELTRASAAMIEPDAGLVGETEVEAEPELEPKPEIGPEPEPEPKPEIGPEPKPAPEVGLEDEPEAEIGPQPADTPEIGPEPSPEEQMAAVPEPELAAEAAAEPGRPGDVGGEANPPTWVTHEPWTSDSPEELEVAAAGEDGGPDGAEVLAADGQETGTRDAVSAAETDTEPSEAGSEPEVPSDQHEGFDAHPTPPPPEIRPPWMEAPSSDDEDLEEAGRRAVDEAIGLPGFVSPGSAALAGTAGASGAPTGDDDATQETGRGWLASLVNRHNDEPPPADTGDDRKVAASTAGIAAIADPEFDFGAGRQKMPAATGDRLEASGPSQDEPSAYEPPTMALQGDDTDDVPGYRTSSVGARDEPPPPTHGLGSLNTQLKIGLLAVLAIVIVLTSLLLINQGPHTSPTASTSPRASNTAHPSPAPSASHAPSPVPSVSSTAPATAQLTEVVTAGAGGSGWRVTGIRIGSPSASSGVTRVVFDLEGPGAQPDVQLGRGIDGAVYLTATGITMSPDIISGFSGKGAITGISQTSSQGLAVRLATSGSPGFSIGYLSVPSRLVLDFK